MSRASVAGSCLLFKPGTAPVIISFLLVSACHRRPGLPLRPFDFAPVRLPNCDIARPSAPRHSRTRPEPPNHTRGGFHCGKKPQATSPSTLAHSESPPNPPGTPTAVVHYEPTPRKLRSHASPSQVRGLRNPKITEQPARQAHSKPTRRRPLLKPWGGKCEPMPHANIRRPVIVPWRSAQVSSKKEKPPPHLRWGPGLTTFAPGGSENRFWDSGS